MHAYSIDTAYFKSVIVLHEILYYAIMHTGNVSGVHCILGYNILRNKNSRVCLSQV